ncbi:MAG: hypothetical protein PHC69_06930 [Ruminiclostridium sp.]|nr:hypothetical protein [Ruminiclostridium sp.]
MNQNNKIERKYYIATFAVLLVYIVVVLLNPSTTYMIQSLAVFLLLCIAAVYDILKNQIPLLICICILLINIVNAVLYECDYRVWLFGFIVILVLTLIFIIGKKSIGLGDVLLLGFSVPAVPLENIVIFLFLTFVLSSIFGLVKGLKKRKFKGITIPLAPCIALSFLAANIL